MLDKDFNSWKRKNVTLRGIKDKYASDNGGMAKYGQGLYTAFLGNRNMTKEYGKVYFVVNAIPKHPKIVNDVNAAEMFLQNIINNWCKKHNMKYNSDYFYSKTNIKDEMLNLGYDGLVIKGREMVNYTPPDNVKYFENITQLERYYDNYVKNSLVEKILKEANEVNEEEFPKTIKDALKMSCEVYPENIDIDVVERINWIINHKSCDNVITSKSRDGIKRACYYNSLKFARKNNCDLAFGYIVRKENFKDYKELCYYYSKVWKKPNHFPTMYGVYHAFCFHNNTIYETTPIDGIGDFIYFYEIIPKEIWKNFNFKENDEEFDATDFHRYCMKLKNEKSYLKEKKIPTLSIFPSALFNRYGFIQRDVTKFISMKDKENIINKLEKLRKTSGEGLPIKKVNPRMLIATQQSIESDNLQGVKQSNKKPFVVQLNRCLLLIDGHHRTANAILDGLQSIDVNFLNLDNYEIKTI